MTFVINVKQSGAGRGKYSILDFLLLKKLVMLLQTLLTFSGEFSDQVLKSCVWSCSMSVVQWLFLGIESQTS
jgi:uncharacterized protein with PQ loop repeat